MKNLTHPIYLFAFLFVLSLVTTGCPIGMGYPLCDAESVEAIDKKLIGTWEAVADSAEIQEVRIGQEDELTYNVEVLRKTDNYLMDTDQFFSWTTKVDGHSFIFSQPADLPDDENFYLYHFAFEGKKLVIHDVSLTVGGVDAVTSIEAFREEVSASLKAPNCLSSRFEYVRK